MKRYKTAVTDYEGMQGVLDSHAEQGWNLFSVSPDTWRRTVSEDRGMESPFEELDDSSRAMREYSASYYLLVFQRSEPPRRRTSYAEAEEPMAMGAAPLGAMPGFEE